MNVFGGNSGASLVADFFIYNDCLLTFLPPETAIVCFLISRIDLQILERTASSSRQVDPTWTCFETRTA